MAKVFAIHEISLNQGTSEQAFERFFREEWANLPAFPGWITYLLKGNRGDRVGRYLVLFEIESVEAQNRMVSEEGKFSEELQRILETTTASWEKWSTFASGPISPTFTDYVVVGETSPSVG